MGRTGEAANQARSALDEPPPALEGPAKALVCTQCECDVFPARLALSARLRGEREGPAPSLTLPCGRAVRGKGTGCTHLSSHNAQSPWPGLSWLVPAIHAFLPLVGGCGEDVGGRDKPGQGELRLSAP